LCGSSTVTGGCILRPHW